MSGTGDMHADVAAALDTMERELRKYLPQRPLLVGIHTGGAWLAEILHRRLELDESLGTIDISFYRDDFTRIGMNPQVKASQLPVGIDERNLILVDDVLHTGRTVRAALNELFSYGRPASVLLAVLVERDGRELPIQADVIGRHMSLGPGQHVKLTGPDSLRLTVLERDV